MAEQLEGRTALVTGGSGGIGVDIARELAERGCDIVLVARREEKLKDVAGEITGDFGVETDWVSMDLARREAPPELYEEMQERDHEIDILVNNAGFGVFGEFMETDWDRQESMLELDIFTPVHLTRLFAEDMIERGWGRMMQVASIGSYIPSPTYASYSAAKAFLLSWGEALAFELDGTGVSCTVVCPGVTETDFFERAGQNKTIFQRASMMNSPTVARIGVRAMLKRRRSITPGFLNALVVWLTRFVPRRLLLWMGYQTMKNE